MAYTTIDDPSAHFHAQLYTGNGSSGLSITNDANAGNIQPDLLWIRPRSGSDNNVFFDSSRGEDKQLKGNGSDAEDTHSPARITFESDGFDLDTTDSNYNGSGSTYVAWQWKANGGSTTTNDASATGVGSQDSVYQANTTARFSIVTYGELGSGGTIAHGLGTTPHLIIVKSRDGSRNWCIYHHKNTSAPETDFFSLDQNVATQDATVWNDTAPTSTVFSVSGDGKVGTDEKYVAYCFAEVQGYSKFGMYKGNNNTDGTFVYLGFRPEFIIMKKTSNTANWISKTGKVDELNTHQKISYLDISNAENTAQDMDLLSNGFKHRSTEGDGNGAETYVYMAWARHPFVSSEGVPCTAV